MKVFYVLLVLGVLIVLGQFNAKIALALAALIFLGSVVLNVNNFQQIITGEVLKQ